MQLAVTKLTWQSHRDILKKKNSEKSISLAILQNLEFAICHPLLWNLMFVSKLTVSARNLLFLVECCRNIINSANDD